MEKIIKPQVISLVDFYGVAGENINYINAKFPLLKVIARGSTIKAIGADDQIKRYEQSLDTIIMYFEKYGHLSPEIIDALLDESPLGKAKKHTTAQGEAINTAETPTTDLIVYGNNGVPIKAKTPAQKLLAKDFSSCDMIFAIGPAGSGKTYTAIALAVKALKNKEVKKIILTRPAVEAGEKLGFLPGDMKEKLDPYLQPLYDALGDMMPKGKLNEYIEEGIVQIAPLAYMRGRTLDNAVVILDEAQNTTKEQLKMFLTRMGRSAKFLITGDMTQVDLPSSQRSGLEFATTYLCDIKGISIIKFAARDILRHPLVGKIVSAYEKGED
ncbi:MAG: PhoH family protein [Rikenellaceae bacterium]